MTTLPTFSEYCDNAQWQQLDEAGLSRILTHIDKRNIGMMTAFRGGGTPVSQNRARNRLLSTDIRQAGFGFLRVVGSFIENEGTPQEETVIEESFLIIGSDHDDSGNLKGFLLKSGAKYGQDAIIYKPFNGTMAYLISLSNRSHMQPIGTFSLNPQNINTMYSQFKGHRFVFHQVSESRGFMSRLAYQQGY